MSKKKACADEKKAEEMKLEKETIQSDECCKENSTCKDDSSNEKEEMNPLLAMKQEIEQLNDKYLRITAEYQNYRKRVEKEKSDIFKFGTEKVMTELLTIMDNFERALAASDEDNVDSKVLDGIKMIKKTFDDFFDRNGVKKIDAVNQPFDPIKHHAVMTVEGDADQNEIVLEVFQDGYVLNDKVIRPSMVKVAN